MRQTIIGLRLIDMEHWEFEQAIWKWFMKNPDQIPPLVPDHDGMKPKPLGTLGPSTNRGKPFVCRCTIDKTCHACYERRTKRLKLLKQAIESHEEKSQPKV